jgi:hypothetical protein
LQAVTRVKPEQASKVKSWMPTRQLTGEGRANGEETDKHLFGPPGYWARHAGKVVWVIGGGPVGRRSHLQHRRKGRWSKRLSERVRGTAEAG